MTYVSFTDPNAVNHILSLIYARAHTEREERLEQQLELFLRPTNVD